MGYLWHSSWSYAKVAPWSGNVCSPPAADCWYPQNWRSAPDTATDVDITATHPTRPANIEHKVNTLRPEYNGWHIQMTFSIAFSHVRSFIFWLRFCCILFLRVQLTTDNKTSLVHEMAWCQTGNEPSPKPMMTKFYGIIWNHQATKK